MKSVHHTTEDSTNILIKIYKKLLHCPSLYLLSLQILFSVSNAIQVIDSTTTNYQINFLTHVIIFDNIFHWLLQAYHNPSDAPETSPYYVRPSDAYLQTSQETGSTDTLSRTLRNLHTLRPAPPPYRETNQDEDCHRRHQDHNMARGQNWSRCLWSESQIFFECVGYSSPSEGSWSQS